MRLMFSREAFLAKLFFVVSCDTKCRIEDNNKYKFGKGHICGYQLYS